uniref:F-box and WD repeat domain containing 10 n=1 Tax=Erpetoichthys calabaricus TaxID=27687 RepID=A0A8C4TEN2_ERPCA
QEKREKKRFTNAQAQPRCPDGFCGTCEKCLLKQKLSATSEWFLRASEVSKRKFLTGIIWRCQPRKLLEKTSEVLQVTLGKDFTYSRSRINPGLPGDRGTFGSDRALDPNVLRKEILQTWDWFVQSTSWTKCNYILGLLLQCEVQLLHVIGNLVRLLLARERFAERRLKSGTCKALTPGRSLLIYKLLILCHTCWICRWSLICYSRVLNGGSVPAHRFVLILTGYLNKQSLSKCLHVSRHWRWLTEEVMKELLVPTKLFFVIMNLSAHSDDASRIIDFSGGKLVAFGSKERQVRFLDITSAKEVPPLIRGHAGSIRALLLCEQRGLVFSGSYDLSIRCWSLANGSCLKIFRGHMGTIHCLDLCGNRLVSGAKDCRVKIWNLETGKSNRKMKFKHQDPIRCVKIDETHVVSACKRGQIKVWHMETATLVKVMDGHRGAVTCLHFDKWHILSGGEDGYIMSWSTHPKYKKSLMTFRHPKEVLCLAFQYLRVISGCEDGKIRVFSFLTGECLRVIRANSRSSPVLSFIADENRLMINTKANILLFQFAPVAWDYTLKSVRELDSAGFLEEDWLKTDAGMLCLISGHCYSVLYFFVSAEILPRTPVDKAPPTRSERLVMQRIKNRGPHHPPTTENILLTINAIHLSQKAEELSANMEINTQVRDAWGPTPMLDSVTSTPQKVTSASTSAKFPGFCWEVTKSQSQLVTRDVEVNLKKSPLSQQVKLNAPKSATTQFKTSPGTGDLGDSSLRKERPWTASAIGVQKVGNFSTTAQHTATLIPQVMTMTTGSVRRQAKVKPESASGERSKQLDPYRVASGFQLCTFRQNKEHKQNQLRQYEDAQKKAREDKTRESRKIWLTKLRGLPRDDFTREGKVAAPELGHGVYL